jgi:hypothetical protein
MLEKIHDKTWKQFRFRASDLFDEEWMPITKSLEHLEQSRYITEGKLFPRQVLRVQKQLTDDSWLDRNYSEIDNNDENLALVKTVDVTYDENTRKCSPYDVKTYIKEQGTEWPRC